MLLFIFLIFYVLINTQICHVCRIVTIDYIVIFAYVLLLFFMLEFFLWIVSLMQLLFFSPQPLSKLCF